MKYIILFIALTCSSTFAALPLTTNLLLNAGAEANSLTNWVPGGDSNPRVDNGTFDTSVMPRSGTNDFLGGTGAAGSLSQIVSLVGNQGITASAIDSGALLAYVSFWEQGLSQGTPSDDAYVSLIFMGATSNSLGIWASPEIDSHTSVWSNYSTYIPIPVNTRFIQYSMNFVRHSGNDLDGFVDDNVLSVASSIQAPRLNVTSATTNIVVSWPALYSDGFILLQATNLTATNWNPVSSFSTNINGTNRVLVSPALRNQFFRLHHP